MPNGITSLPPMDVDFDSFERGDLVEWWSFSFGGFVSHDLGMNHVDFWWWWLILGTLKLICRGSSVTDNVSPFDRSIKQWLFSWKRWSQVDCPFEMPIWSWLEVDWQLTFSLLTHQLAVNFLFHSSCPWIYGSLFELKYKNEAEQIFKISIKYISNSVEVPLPYPSERKICLRGKIIQ